MPTPFPPEYFHKEDAATDSLFYRTPRKVVHIDDGAIRALTEAFARLLPSGGVILDLMSSWRSHLPDTLNPSRVVGLGMNSEEMIDNPALNEHIVHDLNRDPRLPFEDGEFDAAVCTVSVQYLQRPIAVFAEVNRVLKPGGIFILSFSNRCFPTKAVAIWMATNDDGHLALVSRYFEESGGWKDLQTERRKSLGKFGMGDPLYLVYARKL